MFELGEQHRMVATMVRKWCEANLTPRLPALEAGEAQPFDLMRQMARTFALDQMAGAALKKRIDRLRKGEEKKEGEEEGGMGDDPLLAFVLVKELSRVSPGFAMGYGVSVGLAAGAIAAKGSPDQIERWALPLVTTQKIGSWCLTEPGAGSDAFGSMKTAARADGDHYLLTGSKTFITNGPGADIFVVYARIDRGEPREQQAVGAFVVERGMDGFSVGPAFKKMGMRDSPTS
ncbi:MAG TPA: acyl-CoA dehydrogenase family protein, partial [Kofleriaceae bacterium]|nr:acyl-CoA dehydrogenase family protein [Kofleriaceae bacterium]